VEHFEPEVEHVVSFDPGKIKLFAAAFIFLLDVTVIPGEKGQPACSTGPEERIGISCWRSG
jgi:hypothetical protein